MGFGSTFSEARGLSEYPLNPVSSLSSAAFEVSPDLKLVGSNSSEFEISHHSTEFNNEGFVVGSNGIFLMEFAKSEPQNSDDTLLAFYYHLLRK